MHSNCNPGNSIKEAKNANGGDDNDLIFTENTVG